MNRRRCPIVVLISLFLGLPFAALGQSIETQETVVLSSRQTPTGENVTVNVIHETASSTPKAVLLVLPSIKESGKGDATTPALKITRHEPAFYPLYRNRESLLQSGLALAWMDWPSKAEFGLEGATSSEMQKDISSVIKQLRQRWPKTPLILAGTFSGGRTALAYALNHAEDLNGMLVLSPYWLRERNAKVDGLKTLKALVLHDTAGECLATSALEVEEISERAGFRRIPVNQNKIGIVTRCDKDSALWLASADAQLSTVIGDWLDNRSLPEHLGADQPVVTSAERVIFVKGASGRMEVTLYTPSGKGPFPLMVFNHGDMDIDTAEIKYRERLRESIVSGMFVRLGFAVAVPARPGVSRSEGIYNRRFSAGDGDPTYKARYHAESIVAVLDGLKGVESLDLNRVLLTGQSAGGDAVMYMNTLAIPGVRGIIDFSGGRSNLPANVAPAFENRMMIDGWAEMGKKATAPVLLVFTENDSRYSANTIRKSAQAFNDAGGKAELLLLPPVSGDGHFVYHDPMAWAAAAMRFVFVQKLIDLKPPAQTKTVALATAETHPELFDLSRLPSQQGEGCRKLYREFLTKSLPRYFANGSEGKGCGYIAGKDATEEKALATCQKYAARCVTYAIDNTLVTTQVAGEPVGQAHP